MRDLEGARTMCGGASPIAEVRRLRKERDNLKEAVSNTETELMQVCTHVHIRALWRIWSVMCAKMSDELLMGVVPYTLAVF